jgi:hypothetical protein
MSACHAGFLVDKRTPVGSGSIIYLSFYYYWNICSFTSKSPPEAGSFVSAYSHSLFSDAVLIPLLTNSARMGLQVVLFSHHSRTDRPSSQHRLLARASSKSGGHACLALACHRGCRVFRVPGDDDCSSKCYLGNETSLCFNEGFADHRVRSFFHIVTTLETITALDLLLWRRGDGLTTT